MCDSQGPLRDLVLCRCKGLRKLFKAISTGKPPRSLEFANRIGVIERLANKQPEQATELHEANRLLDLLMGELRKADDGAGGDILSADRYTEFIACNS
jgi:hypothetical protein